MKRITGTLIFPFFLIGMMLIFSYGCKKDSNDNNSQTPTGITVTDIDGNVYHAITIGTQVWMTENLKTTRYRNGTVIPVVSDSLEWSTLTTPGCCYLNNDATMLGTYGRFYNWYTVNDTNNIAPAGWHVPTDAEWTLLTTYLGTGAGGQLKTTGTTLWNSPNAGATNSTGFSGLPAGDRSNTGLFHYTGIYGCFWCSTEYSSTDGTEYVLSTNSSNVIRMQYSKGLGISVRCIKD